ncbi:hypothetical protein L6452_09751 [Arctium lappa]|uniref:Uncharacterized protein n=1 Tax=Arctium lappa TaxID=4217 RepID=A0ACB9DLX1_ARCLA|nr:hypothetical protein L6452_09751 [Arctium lappa]
MAPKHLLATFAKVCAEIPASASDGILNIEEEIAYLGVAGPKVEIGRPLCLKMELRAREQTTGDDHEDQQSLREGLGCLVGENRGRGRRRRWMRGIWLEKMYRDGGLVGDGGLGSVSV